MSVDRSDVLHSQFFKEKTRHEETLEGLFRLFSKPKDRLPNSRKGFEKRFHLIPETVGKFSCHTTVQVSRQSSYVRRDGHLIVVQDHNDVALKVSHLVETFT